MNLKLEFSENLHESFLNEVEFFGFGALIYDEGIGGKMVHFAFADNLYFIRELEIDTLEKILFVEKIKYVWGVLRGFVFDIFLEYFLLFRLGEK